MSLQWRYERLDDLGVFALTGRLDTDTAPWFAGALTWPLSRGTGPVILDLTALDGWDDAGRQAISTAARRLATSARQLEIAAAPPDLARSVTGDPRAPITIHPDLASALRAHGAVAPDPGGRRVWQTTDWPAAEPTEHT
ncbi:STAS domain-containing protein [Actinospica sp.]|uniref:STAS domain-containing protein n=1 Tax=Actinospica sp. TaxID=1872142 RepID=UPI002B7C34A4|nr:STAS domain-containing protein [Actinospica sp.]HWG26771.1 STAS domain-containing protein [Actinospica sp.]